LFIRSVVYSENVLATTLDPDGRRVVLSEDAWRHIKRRHPDLTRRLRDVVAVVREPDRRMPGREDREEWFLASAGRWDGSRWSYTTKEVKDG